MVSDYHTFQGPALTTVELIREIPVGAVGVTIAAHVLLQTRTVQTSELVLLTERSVQAPVVVGRAGREGWRRNA